jgi:PAS domain S-box-containing protein
MTSDLLNFSKSRDNNLIKTAYPYFITIFVLLGIEISKYLLIVFPVPFLLLYGSVVLTAFLAGGRAGLVSGIVASGYVIYSGAVGFGPTALTGGVTQILLGVLLYSGTGLIVGQLRDRTTALIGELQESKSRLEKVTRHQSQELKARTTEDRLYKRFLEASPDVMIAVDVNAEIQFVGHGVEALLGYTPEELVGKPVSLLLPERYRGMHDSHLHRFTKTPKRRAMGVGKDLHALHKDGSELPAEISLIPDRSTDGLMVIAAIRDITDRKVVEVQLQQAQKMEAIGNLTGGMAHDFNNLLGVVIGNLDLLRERIKSDAESDALAGEALDAALRGSDLTKQLLAFARRQPLNPRSTDINQLITGTGKLLGRTIGANIEIVFDLGDDVWPVIVDPVQLEASLVNLINNARDAMRGDGIITIRTQNACLDKDYTARFPGLAPGEFTMIEVCDTGSGIPPEVIGEIFEPFFTTKEQGKGTGLGLSMVYGFAKQSGGHINVYSEEGVGTTFRFYLPRDQTSADGEAQEVPVAGMPIRSGSETILVVEDDAALRRIVIKQLKELGYRSFEAENGPEALRILESEAVNLLFTDIIMPGGMSGYDLVRTVRSRWPAMKVLLTSGFTEEKRNGNGGGPIIAPLLQKPYRKQQLASALREVLDG